MLSCNVAVAADAVVSVAVSVAVADDDEDDCPDDAPVAALLLLTMLCYLWKQASLL
jgi:hypothetical protein